jgi:hypothetical protein
MRKFAKMSGICYGPKMPRIRIPLLFLFLSSSCSYRFSNLQLKAPTGGEKLVVESVYSTARDVVSHEFIWSAMQEAILANTHLTLTTRDSADAIVRIHLREVKRLPTGSVTTRGLERDKTDQVVTEDLNLLRSLGLAGEVYDSVLLTLNCEVEVVNLESGKQLFSRNYSVSQKVQSGRSGGSQAVRADTKYINYNEAVGYATKSLSEKLASNFIWDYLK